jgi:hypothetical protein
MSDKFGQDSKIALIWGLGQLARHHGGKIVSFDPGLVALHPGVATGITEN